MQFMEYNHLTQEEVEILDKLIATGQIVESDLPIQGALGYERAGPMIGMDSMGPMRDSKTDELFPGIREALFAFSDTLVRYDLTFVVATNGPDKEGKELLQALNWDIPIRAFAVTQGGGKVIHPYEGNLDHTVLANEDELTHLGSLEERVKNDPVMKVLLEDTQPDAEDAPIKTPYDTNVVLTFPNRYDTLRRRLEASGVQVEKVMPDINEGNYLNTMLGYSATQFTQAIKELKLEGAIAMPLIKKQNRRIYIIPKHLVSGAGDLNKIGGVVLGSSILEANYGYPEHTHANSIYVADKAADVTSEGQLVIGASEKSMIAGVTYFVGEVPPGVKVIKEHEYNPQYGLHIAEVGNKLTINITMDDTLPTVNTVEGVKMLHLGSGLKSLEAITHLYARLHNQ